ncbi:MmyB family transcriptional regulator [Streptomonospora alba]|uniref:MmyB family transcriptional regulator n=1 Tax=Streptomonospora alba TaxID=183763 RepID=UPI00069B1C9C|nr:helix-turn-helix domain-containing protein [Streptomonospora alba]
MSQHGAAGGGRHPGELGAALRSWRERIAPEDVGLPAGRRRRAAGLRREELARLAGMSPDYVVRLEQGRATSPSSQILAALARALRLGAEERRHLFVLAGRREPGSGEAPAELAPSVLRLLDRMEDSPVSVYDAGWTLVAWNRLYAALSGGDLSTLAERERNVVWCHFTGLPTRVRHTAEQQERFERAVVGDLRTACARYPRDAGLHALSADLRRASARFTELWDSHAVGTHTADSKTLHHPDTGPLDLDCDVLEAPGGGHHVVVYTAAPGTEAAEKLRLLGVIGTQNLTGPTAAERSASPDRDPMRTGE